MADESPQEREERLGRQEERLQRQHARVQEGRSSRPLGVGGTLSGIGGFFAEHKTMLIIGGAVAAGVVILWYIYQQNQSSSGNTANEQGSLGNAGYQDSGVAYALTQLGQQLNNLQNATTQAVSSTTPATQPSSTDNTSTSNVATTPSNTQSGTSTGSGGFTLPTFPNGSVFYKGAQGRWWYAINQPGVNVSKSLLNNLFPAGTTFQQQGQNGPLTYTLPGGTPTLFPFPVLSGPPAFTQTRAFLQATGQTVPQTIPRVKTQGSKIKLPLASHSPLRSYLHLDPTNPRSYTMDLSHKSFFRSPGRFVSQFHVRRPPGGSVVLPAMSTAVSERPFTIPFGTIGVLRSSGLPTIPYIAEGQSRQVMGTESTYARGS